MKQNAGNKEVNKIINRLQLILIKEKLQFSIMHMPDVYSRIHLQPINQAQ